MTSFDGRSSIKSLISISLRLAELLAPIPQPIRVFLRISAISLQNSLNRKRADINQVGFLLTSKGADAKRAKAMASFESKCIFSPTCMSSVKSAQENALIAKHSRFIIKDLLLQMF